MCEENESLESMKETGDIYETMLDDLHHFGYASPTVKTVFDGQPDEEFLNRRIDEILQLNPWLFARLRTDPGSKELIWWVPHDRDIEQIYHTETLGSNDQVITHCDPKWVVETAKASFNCLAQPPHTRLVLVKGPKKYAIVISLSHAMADAHTVFTVLGMLNTEENPRAMIFQRSEEWLGEWKWRLGQGSADRHQWFYENCEWSALNVEQTYDKLRNVPDAPTATTWLIRPEWIQEQKRLFQQTRQPNDPEFISSNDVITSWFARQMKDDAIMMAVNMRDRDTNDTTTTALHVGCYLSGMICFPEEYENPATIRRIVDSSGECFLEDAPAASPNQNSSTCSLISNWHGFYRHLAPNQTLQHCVWRKDQVMIKTAAIAIVFQATEGTQGIFLHIPANRCIQDISPLGENIADCFV